MFVVLVRSRLLLMDWRQRRMIRRHHNNSLTHEASALTLRRVYAVIRVVLCDHTAHYSVRVVAWLLVILYDIEGVPVQFTAGNVSVL